MSKVKTFSFVSVVLVFLIICLTFTMLQGYFPLFRRQWIFLAVICAIGLFFSSTFLYTRQFACLLVYFLIIYINALSGDYYWRIGGRALYEFLILLAPSIIAWYAFQKQDEKLMVMIMIVFFGIVVFETIVSYIANLQFPEIIRVLSNMRDEDVPESAFSYYRMGVANYDIGHALPALIPLLIMGIKNKSLSQNKHWLFVILLFFILVLIYISFSTTALIMAVFGLVLALFTQKGKAAANAHLFILALFFIPFLLSDSLILGSLDAINGFVPSDSSLHSKINEIQQSIILGDATGDMGIRKDRYSQSITAFSHNIIFGANVKVGGHSSFLDRLATLGVLGFIPYILFIIFQIAFGYKQIDVNSRVYYVEAVSLSLLMLLAKDADSWELLFTMLTLVPFMSYLLNKRVE